METENKNPLPPIVFRRGKNVCLGPVEDEHMPFVTRGINDPDVNQFLTVTRPMSSKAEADWHANLAKRTDDVISAITITGTGEFVGLIGLHRIQHVHGTATMGFWIMPKFWGKGHGSEALMLLLDYCFSVLNLRKISASVYDFNPRSKRSQEKCGFKQEALLKAEKYRLGRYVDEIVMAVFKEDFLPLWDKFKREVLDKK